MLACRFPAWEEIATGYSSQGRLPGGGADFTCFFFFFFWFFFFLKSRLYFLKQFQVPSKTEQKVQILLIYAPYSSTPRAPSTVNSHPTPTLQSGTLAIINELALN